MRHILLMCAVVCCLAAISCTEQSADRRSPSISGAASANNALAEPPLARVLVAIGRNDLTTAAKLAERAAKDGDPGAQWFLGNFYADGRGVARDPVLAAQWIERAALQGHVEALFQLAALYQEGRGVPQSFTRAAGLYELAARTGHGAAAFNLALMHERAEGHGAADLEGAAKWYRVGAEAGHALCQRHLGLRYAQGKGVERDVVEALMWLTLSAAQAGGKESEEKSIQARDYVRESMARPDQVAEAQRRAADWKPKQTR